MHLIGFKAELNSILYIPAPNWPKHKCKEQHKTNDWKYHNRESLLNDTDPDFLISYHHIDLTGIAAAKRFDATQWKQPPSLHMLHGISFFWPYLVERIQMSEHTVPNSVISVC